MRNAYRILATVLAVEIIVQAAVIVYFVSGLLIWVDQDGGTLDKAALDNEVDFTGVGGIIFHGVNGMIVVPLIALALLIVSFFAKVPRGTPVAVVLFALVVIQVALGIAGRGGAVFGALHGLVALLIFAGALDAARLPRKVAADAGRDTSLSAPSRA